jgi:lipoate-protein ligase A
MELWRLITTWGAHPAFNMGLDQALLESSESAPTLRFYSWRPDTLSLGYFQRFEDVPAASGSGGQRPRAIVRRITGGGAIHHVQELTFSIAAPLTHRLYQGPIAASYERVHAAVRSALLDAGVESELRGARTLDSDVAGTGMCFHHSTSLDLCWGGRKGVGSAQRRSKGRVLHHGSIKLWTSPFEGDIATVGTRAGEFSPELFAPLLRTAFESAFSVVCEAGVPTSEERDAAREYGPRYLAPEFVQKR